MKTMSVFYERKCGVFYGRGGDDDGLSLWFHEMSYDDVIDEESEVEEDDVSHEEVTDEEDLVDGDSMVSWL